MPRQISDEQILKAALKVFAKQGYSGSTTREIAAAAGINEVTLFRRFGSKQNLMQQIIEREAQQFVAKNLRYSGDVAHDLLTIVTFYQGLMRERRQAIAMMLSEIPRSPELRQIFQTSLSVVKNVIEILVRYQAEGILKQEPPPQCFFALIGPIFAQGMFQHIEPEFFGQQNSAESLVQGFLQGRKT